VTPPAASAAAPAINPRRTVTPRRVPAAPRRPRRVSGPARSQTPSPARAVGLAETVATHRLLDRLISGRIWIGVIAFALIGIVTMQLGLLKLNAGIGRSLEREALLQRENTTLNAENSEIAAGESVESQAERMGMELIPSGAVRFLAVRPSIDASKAAAALSATVSTATATGAQATASNASTTGETSALSTASAGEAATTPSASSTGEVTTTPAATTTEAAAPPSPATPTETPASSVSTATSTGGASEAATPSASISTGGGTTPGG
jgi:hypothetical protein